MILTQVHQKSRGNVANKCGIFDASEKTQQLLSGSTSACATLSVKKQVETRQLQKTPLLVLLIE